MPVVINNIKTKFNYKRKFKRKLFGFVELSN